jgi:hypothetical protein
MKCADLEGNYNARKSCINNSIDAFVKKKNNESL